MIQSDHSRDERTESAQSWSANYLVSLDINLVHNFDPGQGDYGYLQWLNGTEIHDWTVFRYVWPTWVEPESSDLQ